MAEKSFWDQALDLLGMLAPGLATALGGPLAGAATLAVTKALGVGDDTSKEDLAKVLLSAGPEKLAAVQAAGSEFAKAMQELNIQLLKVDSDDRANARQRQVSLNDHTPAVLAYLVSVGFFSVLGFLLVMGKPAVGGDALLVMLGSLGTAWTAIISYYFGSTAGSKAKTDALAAAGRGK